MPDKYVSDVQTCTHNLEQQHLLSCAESDTANLGGRKVVMSRCFLPCCLNTIH